MLDDFRHHVLENFQEFSSSRLLIAVSGGLDSMTLVDLCLKLGYSISLAHCNFNLRGDESDLDARFVTDFAQNSDIELHIQNFDTAGYARDSGLSIQVAARNLRYKWFMELADSHGYDFILTAHHLDDAIETFIINLSRGTGIDGLTGIPARNGRIIRPLLDFTREQIYRYAMESALSWREDSSNESNKYMRNTVRHEIVPRLKSLNRNFEESFANTISYLQQTQSMARDAAVMAWRQVTIEKDTKTIFKIHDLLKIPDYGAYLHFWLKDYGFTAWNDVYDLVNAESGKRVYGKGFFLVKDRETLVLSQIEDSVEGEFAVGRDGIDFPVGITFSSDGNYQQTTKNRILVNFDKIKFPLKLRRCREGDYFYPLGMEGRKKVSKYLRDQKLSLEHKTNTWLLLSGNDILWIVGMRQDRRFAIDQNTKHILQIHHD